MCGEEEKLVQSVLGSMWPVHAPRCEAVGGASVFAPKSTVGWSVSTTGFAVRRCDALGDCTPSNAARL